MAPDDTDKVDMQALLAQMEEREHRWKEQEEDRERRRKEHVEQMASMADLRAGHDAQVKRLDAMITEQKARPPLKPEDFNTTIVQVRSMAQKDVHPTWMHAAYADLAGRMARLSRWT
jgi:hypothetical protein